MMLSKKMTRFFRILLIAAFIAPCLSTAAFAASYYVDSVSGNDSYAGSLSAPWKTVAKVNGRSFTAGDTIYFKRGGIWNEVLNPSSGTSGGYITYGSYGTGNKPRLYCFYSDGKSYVKVQDMEFRANSNYQAFHVRNFSHHIIAQNCDIVNDINNTSYCALYLENASYCQILSCTVNRLNLSSQGDACTIRLTSQYNLLLGNTFGSATHYALTLEGANDSFPNAEIKYNIIRNNTISNPAGAQLELQSSSNLNVVEGNIISGAKDSGFVNGCPRSFKLVTKNNIVRRNIIKNNTVASGSGISSEVYRYSSNFPPNIATQNHIYNNVITNVAHYPVVLATNGTAGVSAFNNYYINNIFYNNGSSWDIAIQNDPVIYNNYFSNNLIFNPSSTNVILSKGSSWSVSTIQPSDPTHFAGNLQIDPKLDSTHQLMSGSPCIDTGAFLTTVTSATGSGTSFAVVDAGFFTDGFGIVTGDTIRVGTLEAIISSINYTSNTITLKTAISWTKGANVSLQYSGSRPDIGASEYSMFVSSLATPTNLRVLN